MSKDIIEYYKNYLLKKNKYDEKVIEEDINVFEKQSKLSLNELLKKSEEYKLYDKDYEHFMYNMGKFAILLNKLESTNDSYMKVFLELNYTFEELQQRNIMKDAYIWR